MNLSHLRAAALGIALSVLAACGGGGEGAVSSAADRFFATALGGVYSAKGSVTNGRITAREVQAEDIED